MLILQHISIILSALLFVGCLEYGYSLRANKSDKAVLPLSTASITGIILVIGLVLVASKDGQQMNTIGSLLSGLGIGCLIVYARHADKENESQLRWVGGFILLTFMGFVFYAL